MNALLIVLAILVGVAAYFAAGIRLAGRPYITREMDRHCSQYPNLNTPADLERWRRQAAGESLFVAAIWPLYFAFRAITGHMAASAPLCDHEARRKVEQQGRRIAELERELGIGRRM